jgi:hypothetical protein
LGTERKGLVPKNFTEQRRAWKDNEIEIAFLNQIGFECVEFVKE